MPRYTRLDDVPPYALRPDCIEPRRWARVRRVLHRAGGPLRLDLPGLCPLELILQADAWVVVDAAQGDLPIIAWTGFSPVTALHLPVECELRYYHLYGTAVRARALDLMDEALERMLDLPARAAC